MASCIICNKKLVGRQTKYCSIKCKNKDSNHRHNSSKKQNERGTKRKLKLIEMSGGKCILCGYNKCIASLSFHHVDPKQKKFCLDMRALSNRTWERVFEEFQKCQLLCMNCHFELHYNEYHPQ